MFKAVRGGNDDIDVDEEMDLSKLNILVSEAGGGILGAGSTGKF